jgi:hypothetical protein
MIILVQWYAVNPAKSHGDDFQGVGRDGRVVSSGCRQRVLRQRRLSVPVSGVTGGRPHGQAAPTTYAERGGLPFAFQGSGAVRRTTPRRESKRSPQPHPRGYAEGSLRARIGRSRFDAAAKLARDSPRYGRQDMLGVQVCRLPGEVPAGHTMARSWISLNA